MTNAQAIGRLKEMLDANMDSEEAAVRLDFDDDCLHDIEIDIESLKIAIRAIQEIERRKRND